MEKIFRPPPPEKILGAPLIGRIEALTVSYSQKRFNEAGPAAVEFFSELFSTPSNEVGIRNIP